ncbi:hypothetical protein BC937DRAFT_93909 [Endogone sp. FLAS-F59071]|nr:hypothetical protein BC937DRAFT_93909 [Endogone sp. FLAS-F59071]|eukprot:RUS20984.1 hypothetical protein BC937DRAFT_93909 [Endogone sp. FLAS-F59071]
MLLGYSDWTYQIPQCTLFHARCSSPLHPPHKLHAASSRAACCSRMTFTSLKLDSFTRVNLLILMRSNHR